jgi:hypothetical protein
MKLSSSLIINTNKKMMDWKFHTVDASYISPKLLIVYADVDRELLNKWPDLTQMIDENGNSALHHAWKL